MQRPARGLRAQQRVELWKRWKISRGLIAGQSLRSLARQLNRSPSGISREVARNGGDVGYRACAADDRAWRQALRPKPCVLAGNERLRDVVAGNLLGRPSPKQIAGWLKAVHHNDMS